MTKKTVKGSCLRQMKHVSILDSLKTINLMAMVCKQMMMAASMKALSPMDTGMGLV